MRKFLKIGIRHATNKMIAHLLFHLILTKKKKKISLCSIFCLPPLTDERTDLVQGVHIGEIQAFNSHSPRPDAGIWRLHHLVFAKDPPSLLLPQNPEAWVLLSSGRRILPAISRLSGIVSEFLR